MYDEFLNFIFPLAKGAGRYNSPISGATTWG